MRLCMSAPLGAGCGQRVASHSHRDDTSAPFRDDEDETESVRPGKSGRPTGSSRWNAVSPRRTKVPINGKHWSINR
jgi:hypothetical protein